MNPGPCPLSRASRLALRSRGWRGRVYPCLGSDELLFPPFPHDQRKFEFSCLDPPQRTCSCIPHREAGRRDAGYGTFCLFATVVSESRTIPTPRALNQPLPSGSEITRGGLPRK